MTSSERGWFESPRFARLRRLSRLCLAPWSIVCIVGLAWGIQQLVWPTPEREPAPIEARRYQLEGFKGEIYTVDWSPDETLLAPLRRATHRVDT